MLGVGLPRTGKANTIHERASSDSLTTRPSRSLYFALGLTRALSYLTSGTKTQAHTASLPWHPRLALRETEMKNTHSRNLARPLNIPRDDVYLRCETLTERMWLPRNGRKYVS